MPKRNGPGIELLADPTRRRLIAAIAIRPRRPSSLAEEIGLSRPATTRQLHLLQEAGLIRASRAMTDRRGIVFTMDQRSHGQITAWLVGTEIGRRPRSSGSRSSVDEGLESTQLAGGRRRFTRSGSRLLVVAPIVPFGWNDVPMMSVGDVFQR